MYGMEDLFLLFPVGINMGGDVSTSNTYLNNLHKAQMCRCRRSTSFGLAEFNGLNFSSELVTQAWHVNKTEPGIKRLSAAGVQL